MNTVESHKPDHPSLKSEGYIRYPGCDACAFSYLAQFVADLQLAIRGNNKTSDCPASMIFTLASLASTVITVNTVTNCKSLMSRAESNNNCTRLNLGFVHELMSIIVRLDICLLIKLSS